MLGESCWESDSSLVLPQIEMTQCRISLVGRCSLAARRCLSHCFSPSCPSSLPLAATVHLQAVACRKALGKMANGKLSTSSSSVHRRMTCTRIDFESLKPNEFPMTACSGLSQHLMLWLHRKASKTHSIVNNIKQICLLVVQALGPPLDTNCAEKGHTWTYWKGGSEELLRNGWDIPENRTMTDIIGDNLGSKL